MPRYLLARVGQAVLVLWAAFTITFLILYALPGDAVSLLLGEDGENNLTAEQLDAVRVQYGLDLPLYQQYLNRLGGLLTGDLGMSYASNRPVADLIAEAIPQTAQIAFAGLALGVTLGAAIAIAATYTRFAWLSRLLTAIPPLGVAVPSFWLGLMLLQVVSFRYGLLPAMGNEGLASIVLPAITLAIPNAATVAQLLNKGLETTLGQPYIETARAKGASRRRVHLRHALRNAALPTLTLAGLMVGGVLGGSVVTETVFSRAGLGRLTATSVSARDVPTVLGIVVIAAAVYVVVNLIVDLVYPLVDPRVVTTRRRTPIGRATTAIPTPEGAST
ncbi:ABC transporter permease [Occultella kanbiaonis]|uniref:ABC transporter permease n=1 Tax=Occultella kanbiaonis TaxID=2675754 RepID=UPI0012B992EB|nr:ABC transporter permease [Occultella kanbiaonis]